MSWTTTTFRTKRTRTPATTTKTAKPRRRAATTAAALNSHNFGLLHLLTFATVIGSQFHLLSSASTTMLDTMTGRGGSTTAATTPAAANRLAAAAATRFYFNTTPTATAASTTTTQTLAAIVTAITQKQTFASQSTAEPKTGEDPASTFAAALQDDSPVTGASLIIAADDGDQPRDSGIGNNSLVNTTLNSKKALPLDLAFKHRNERTQYQQDTATSFHASYSATSRSLDGHAGPGEMERPRSYRISSNKHHHEHHWGPFFEAPQVNGFPFGDGNNNKNNSMMTSLTTTGGGGNGSVADSVATSAHLYTEAVLNCRVGMLKDKTVMWVRRTTEKVSLLTVGNVTYSGDPRIRVKFQYPNNWRLLINPIHREDEGVYMCQVSTHPPRVFSTNLTILEPPLQLIDEQERAVGDRYYKAGSAIDLQCQVSRSFLLKEKASIQKSISPTSTTNYAVRATTAASAIQSNTPKSATAASSIARSAPNELLPSGGNQSAKDGLGSATESIEKKFSHMIFWTKNNEPLPEAAEKRTSTTDKWLNIRVTIPEAKLSDSGNYSCSIGKLFTAIVQVQVLTGELPAAVQHNAAAARTMRPTTMAFRSRVKASAQQQLSHLLLPSVRPQLLPQAALWLQHVQISSWWHLIVVALVATRATYYLLHAITF